jgi:FKBP-type peptidyl-prolyl cis-trans isomerase
MLHRVALCLLVALAPLAAVAEEDAPKEPAAEVVKSTAQLPDEDAKLSYGIGVNVAKDLKRQPFGVNVEEFWAGYKIGVEGGESKFSREQWMALAQEMQAKMQAEKPEFTAEETATISYVLGEQTGKSMKSTPIKLNEELFKHGFSDVIEAKEPALSEDEIMAVMQSAETRLQAEQQKMQAEAGAKNTAEGTAFLAENGKREGVKTTVSGLQYEVITEGEGTAPKPEDTVKVHYKGTLIDGTEFDSSYSRGEPAEFQLNQVIPGWTEGLQLMKPGAKYKFAIPSAIAYGARAMGDKIGPNSTLVFEVELLEVKVAEAAAPSITIPAEPAAQ